jgi:hypothetical protein
VRPNRRRSESSDIGLAVQASGHRRIISGKIFSISRPARRRSLAPLGCRPAVVAEATERTCRNSASPTSSSHVLLEPRVEMWPFWPGRRA